MPQPIKSRPNRRTTTAWRLHPVLAVLVLCCGLVLAPSVRAQDAAALRARHLALSERWVSSELRRGLVLESSESSNGLQGDIYARVELPFALVRPALMRNEQWCDILMLHLNVKQCRSGQAAAGPTLGLVIGSKYDQPLADAYNFDFTFREVASSADYMQVMLGAERGPMGTTHYRILLEAVALDTGRSFVHLSYAYGYGTAARMAMQVYLATIGRNKVGFSVVGHEANGAPQYIGGTRGVVERNTMRYYLALEAYLGALGLPAAQQAERRLNDWFAAVERYPAQLHELELGQYLALKREQLQRQQVSTSAPASRVTTEARVSDARPILTP